CEPCIAGKQRRPDVPRIAQHHASKPLDLLHIDLHGPVPVRTPEGYRHWHLIVDD
ncbi:hypothetical protein PUNSTDRAFT_21066, partial [Punctularia strigosozonata HHB-11173 SS5]|uniref:uncharacterized protein n=1 Tax=Punctularia strigosozonata (strain HHB-11173) TaxID=741275 RepID=UPI0004416C1E